MKNIVVCKNCSNENPMYELNCQKCKALLRSRIVNIDLWSTIWKIFESPSIAIKEIILAEHKNFVILLILIAGLRFLSNSLVFANTVRENFFSIDYILLNFIVSTVYLLAIIYLFAFALTVIGKAAGNIMRIKDNISIYIFSFIPQLFALVVLFPIIYGLFGQFWFTHNPSPFDFKPLAAYVLCGIEIIMLLWSTTILSFGNYVQTNRLFFSIIFSIAFEVTIVCCMAFLPLIPF